jgi:c-di-GMP-binding flagellar brake protein YcgR
MDMVREPEDKRSAVRFPIKLPVEVSSDSTRGYRAETKDISAGGILFYVDAEMPLGARIEFNISMPAAVLGTPSDVKVKCVGRVVRCSAEDGRKAIAAVIDEYRFDRD